MKHLFWTLVVAASLAAPLPAAGQHAVPRGGGGSDGGGSSSSGGSTSSGGSSSGGSGGGSTMSSGSSGGGSTWAPPRHPGGSSSSGRSGGSSGTASARSRGDGGSGSGSGPNRVVPETGGRTRDGRPITGYAVPRPTAPGTVVPGGRPGGDFYYYPRGRNWYHVPYYYSPYYYAGFGAGFWGLGYIWDPFWWGPAYDPWYGGGFGGYAFGAGGGGGSSDDYDEPTEGTGALRIKVKPREAKVMVDGTLAGVVDDFDGNFQKLRLDAGSHSIELQADGYEPLKFDVLIVEDQTITYKGKLRER